MEALAPLSHADVKDLRSSPVVEIASARANVAQKMDSVPSSLYTTHLFKILLTKFIFTPKME
jgi:hypothetical protein